MKILGLAALVFLALRSGRARAPAVVPRVPASGASLPGSAGTGWQQVLAGGLVDFLRTASTGVSQGATANPPPNEGGGYQAATIAARASIVQDGVDPSTEDIYNGVFY